MIKKILLIEDDIFVSELYQRVLSKKGGFEVVTALDGQEGLAASRDKPDLILLDIMLPKINGIDVLKKLRATNKTKDIPVVLLTNLGQESIVKEAIRIGAQDYLIKTNVSPYELVEYIKNLANKKPSSLKSR